MKTVFRIKRYLIWAVVPVILLGLLSVRYAASNIMVDKIIIIDAGHGGIDPGANRPGVLEKDINLAIALQLKDNLHKQGAKVVMTRAVDMELSNLCDNNKVKDRYHRDLNARIEMVEESDADIFISIHANASSKVKQRGVECYYSGKSEAGKRLAEAIEGQLQAVTKINHEATPAPFFVLRRNKVPAVLIEVGYITNLEERDLLQTTDYQQHLAEAISTGIHNYYQKSMFEFHK